MKFSHLLPLAGLALLVASRGYGQLGFGAEPTRIAAPNSINYCEAAPEGYFEIDWVANGDVAAGELQVVLPVGARFINGSKEDLNTVPAGTASTYTRNGDTLRFRFRNLADASSGTVRYRLAYNCRIDDVFAAPYSLLVRAVSTETFAIRTSPINNTASVPLIRPQSTPDSDERDVEPGDTFARGYAIQQTGQRSRAYAFQLCMDYGPGLTVSNRTLEGQPVTFSNPAGGGCVTVDEANFPGLPWPFEQDDVWTYREEVTVEQCGGTGTTVRTNFACGQACQAESRLALGVEFADNAPTVRHVRSARTIGDDACIADGAGVEAEFEVTGKAYRASFELTGYAEGVYVDPASIEVDYGDGVYRAYAGGVTPVDGDVTTCAPGRDRRLRLDELATPIDATAAPRAVRVRYRVKYCCEATPASAFELEQLYGYRTRLDVYDKCGARQFAERYRNGYTAAARGTADVPEAIADGDTLTWAYEFTAFGLSTDLRADSRLCVAVTLPQGLRVPAGARARYLSVSGAEVQSPVALDDLGGGRYRACFGEGRYSGMGARLTLPVTYVCSPAVAGSVATSTATVSLGLGDATCTGPGECDLTLYSATADTYLGDECVAPACDGVRHVSAAVARTTYGVADADRDGCADADPAVDPTVVRRDNATEGDRVELVSDALVTLSAPGDALDYLTVDVALGEAHLLEPTATLEVFDAGTGERYAFGGVAVSPSGVAAARVRLVAGDLAGRGTIPTGYRFADGDSLRLRLGMEVVGNAGCATVDVEMRAEWYADRSAMPGADRLQCNLPPPAGYHQVGYAFQLQSWTTRRYGCAGTTIEFRHTFCVGGGIDGSAAWPGEIRDYGLPTASEFEVPPGMSLDSVHLRNLFATRAAGLTAARYNVDVTEYATRVGDRVEVDWEAIRADCAGLPFVGGAGYRFVLKAFLGGSCASEATQPQAALTTRFDYPAGASAADRLADRREFGYGNDVAVRVPALALSAQAEDIAPFDQTATWRLSLRETAGAAAPNAWLAVVSPSGQLRTAALEIDGVVVEATDGLYLLGDLPASAIRQVTLAAAYRSCGADSLRVLVGWECSDYPGSAEDVLSGGTRCEPLALTLRMTPQAPAIQQAIIRQPARKTVPCEDLTYELELLNVTSAVIYEPVFELFVPYTSGIDILPGTERASYPSPRRPVEADFGVALGVPVQTITTPVGIKYVWDLDALVPEFDFRSDRGWEGRASDDPDARRISIRFRAKTNCEHIIGDYLNFRVRGRSYCGEEAVTVLRNGREIEFAGVTTPYTATLELAAADTIEACTADGLVAMAGTVAFFGETDGEDVVLLALPPALRFEALTSDAGDVFDLTRITTRRIESADGSDIGFDEVRVPVFAGVSSFTTIPFALSARVDPAGLLCDDLSTLKLRTVRDVTYECVRPEETVTCTSPLQTGTLLEDPTFALATDTFGVRDLALALDAEGTALALANLTVDNLTGDPIVGDLTLEVYRDVDGNGRESTDDELVASYLLTGGVAGDAAADFTAAAVAVGGELDACALIGVVRGCACGRIETPVASLAIDNAGAPGEDCSGRPLTLGATAAGLPGYAYRWYAAAGSADGALADAAAPRTTLRYTNPTRTPEVLTYVLESTSREGCVSTDTVRVTVNGSCSTIGDYTWVDLDGDGLQGDAEPPLSGVTVTLFDAATDAVVATATTDADGRYGFDDEAAGAYYVVFDGATSGLGAAYRFTARGAVADAPDDSNADEDGRTAAFAFDPETGPVYHVDAGLRPVGDVAAVRYAEKFETLADGTVVAEIVTAVRNVGTSELTEFAVTQDFGADFGASFVAEEHEGLGALAAATLAPGEEVSYRSFVTFAPEIADYPVLTQVTVAATVSVGGRAVSDAGAVADASDSGRDFLGTNPGEPGDTGGDDDPLAITCLDAEVLITGADAVTCAGGELTLIATHAADNLGAPDYTWRFAGADEVISTDREARVPTPERSRVVELTLTNPAGACRYGVTDTARLATGRVPTLLTPDGNGANDRFAIPCLEAFPGSAITIYNRWGDAVYASDAYAGEWDGTFGGEPLPEGTYFYVLAVANAEGQTLNGYVYLKR